MTPSYEPEPPTAAGQLLRASLVHVPLAAVTVALVAQPLLRPYPIETLALVLPNAGILGLGAALLELRARRVPGARAGAALGPLLLVAACAAQDLTWHLMIPAPPGPAVFGAQLQGLLARMVAVAAAALAVTVALLARTEGVQPAAEEVAPRREGRPWLRLVGAVVGLLLAGLAAIAFSPRSVSGPPPDYVSRRPGR